MRTKYYAYDRWVSLFIVTCETLITGGLFYLLFLTTEDTPWHKILQAPHLQVILTVMLCYFVSAMQAGVVLYRRKVYAYQILSKVLKCNTEDAKNVLPVTNTCLSPITLYRSAWGQITRCVAETNS